MSELERHLVWTDERCAGCERLPYRRRDGREYLYRYGDSTVAVCKPQCVRKADQRASAAVVLSCGCVFTEDGSRAWCTSCARAGRQLPPQFAAAPELLRACRALLLCYRDGQPLSDGPIVNAIREAVAKAEGRASHPDNG